MRFGLAWLLLFFFTACAVDPSGLPGDDTHPSDAQVGDGGQDAFGLDSGPVDMGRDVGMVDLGDEDLGPDDLGPPDQGPPDQGPPDQGPPDQGPPDQGPPDQGPPDQGPPDLGPPDLGPPDLGPPDLGGCVPAAESCNARDDDCDGRVDEDPGGPRGENICAACVRHVSPAGITYQLCERDQWDGALDTCRSNGYELASPETMAEDEYLDRIIGSGNDYWIALNDRDTEGTFEWEDRPNDRPLGAFTDWDPATSEPNGGGGDDCVRIEADTKRWRDSDCQDWAQTQAYAACEAPAP